MRCFGTEGRSAPTKTPASLDIFAFIVFNASDIKELVVIQKSTESNPKPKVTHKHVKKNPTLNAGTGDYLTSLPAKGDSKSQTHASEFDFHESNSRFDKTIEAAAPDGDLPNLDEITQYDKSKSFFDDITDDRTVRLNTQYDVREHRKLNHETFGVAEHRSVHNRGGRGRGGRARQRGRGQWKTKQ